MADNIGNVGGEIANAPGVIVQPQNVQIIVIDGDDTGDEAHPEPSSSISPPISHENRSNVDASENERTPGRKRRKRMDTNVNIDVHDDGTHCPICHRPWEMVGDHRVIALKCGHLFGESCVKRLRLCPTCKKKAPVRENRHIYSKKIIAVDKSEEYRLQELVELEKAKNFEQTNKVMALRGMLAKYNLELQTMNAKLADWNADTANNPASYEPKTYKLSLDKNIEITRDAGCRAMVFGKRSQSLIISQKSSQSLFPGFGVRFMTMNGFALTNFLLMSAKAIRDLALDNDEELLVSATFETTVKMYSISNRAPVSTFTPSDKLIWSAAFDRTRPKYLYLGAQHGSTYVYDIRSPHNYIEEYPVIGDVSPVVSICSIPFNDEIPFGGVVVCKLRSLWFYEYTAAQTLVPNKLDIDGPFVAVSYDDLTKHLLVSTRPNPNHPAARFIIGTVGKNDGIVFLNIVRTIMGSKTQAMMSRGTQIRANEDIVVAAYLQDSKQIATWNSHNGRRMQSLPVSDVILDTCPLYVNDKVYLSALSETRCRIFQINSQ